MTSPGPGSGLRTTVTRIHAICLFLITIATTTGSTIGWKGRGPLDVLASQPYGYVGLFQAYFLMFLLALVPDRRDALAEPAVERRVAGRTSGSAVDNCHRQRCVRVDQQ